jgi:hypothetical protein
MTTTNPTSFAHSVGFVIPDNTPSEDDFRAAFDDTIARNVEASAPNIPADILALLGDDHAPKPTKGLVAVSSKGVLQAGYIIDEDIDLDTLINRIHNDITNAPVAHGFVTVNVYTRRDENPTHFFIMEPGSDEFTVHTFESYNNRHNEFYLATFGF